MILEKYHLSILRFLEERGNITLMEFSLFAFMLSKEINKSDSDMFHSECMNIWFFAHEISQGLRQVAQNAIQHTDGRECFFSFCFHEKKRGEETNNFINRISQFYPDTFFDFSENPNW